jgi:hypothetical protein
VDIAGGSERGRSSAAGGLCAVIVGHPFDLVKVRLQTAEKGIYSGAMLVFQLLRGGGRGGHCGRVGAGKK